MPASSVSRDISARWRKLLELLPGYDSARGVEALGLTFDEAEADRYVDFVECYLTHTKGELAGKPLVLEPWQRAIIGALFGWKRPDGTRRYREALIYVPRKNGKTTITSGIALALLCCDAEPGAEVYVAAAEKDQARILFDIAREQVAADPDLSASLTVRRNAILTRRTGDAKTLSKLVPLSSDAHTKHGYNGHGIIVDELHAQPDRELVDVLTTSTGSRRQPLTVYITTADYERPSICNTIHDYAKKVRDGIIEAVDFLPVIYEAELSDDWTRPEVWKQANPNLGVSVSLEYLERQAQKAREEPSYENTFRRLHLNVRTEQAERWLRLDKWQACGVDLRDLDGAVAFGGLDLATTTDLAALVLVFPRDDGTYDVLPRFWAPEEGARRRERHDRVPYLTWARQGYLTLTPGEVTDYDEILRQTLELCARHRVQAVAFDRWNATQLVTQMGKEGVEVVAFGQGYASMSAPSKELEKLVMSQRLRHAGHPILSWCASNVAIERDAAANIKPSKKKSTEKIDGIVALVMALGLATSTPVKGPSVYETRGVEVLR